MNQILPVPPSKDPVGFWNHPVVIRRSNFLHKSLSDFSCNTAIGCGHECGFCYVPSVSANKQAGTLAEHGVNDPDAEWGSYALLRPWVEKEFCASLAHAERTPAASLSRDGNRAVLFCSTTDAYQVFHHPDPARSRELNEASRLVVQSALERIRDRSTLRVRILTRSSLAKRDFELFKSFGPRLLFGMSLPTLRNDLARVYEAHAPAPSQRLATLRAAKAAGLNVFVALAPTYPECDTNDLAATLQAVASLDPVTVYHEPINIRAENVARLGARANSLGVPLRLNVFDSAESWRAYAMEALTTVETLAPSFGLQDRLHLWPDTRLGSKAALAEMPNPGAHAAWLDRAWNRVSEWPA